MQAWKFLWRLADTQVREHGSFVPLNMLFEYKDIGNIIPGFISDPFVDLRS